MFKISKMLVSFVATLALTVTAFMAAPASQAAEKLPDLSKPKISHSKVTIPTKIGSSKKNTFKIKFTADKSKKYVYYAYVDDSHQVGRPDLIDSMKYADISPSNSTGYSVYTKKKVKPGKSFTFTLETISQTTPGKYRLPVTIAQYEKVNGEEKFIQKKTSSTTFVIKANPKVSERNTTYTSQTWGKNKKKLDLILPAYQTGGKVTAYFKANGSKKWKKLGTGKIKADKIYQ